MNANPRRIKQPQMKKTKTTSNENFAFIKSKKPQMKTLKRIQINKCERTLPKVFPTRKPLFFWKQTWRNEICMVEVSIGKEEKNLKDDKVCHKNNNAHLLWLALILSMKNGWLEMLKQMMNFVNNCWKAENEISWWHAYMFKY